MNFEKIGRKLENLNVSSFKRDFADNSSKAEKVKKNSLVTLNSDKANRLSSSLIQSYYPNVNISKAVCKIDDSSLLDELLNTSTAFSNGDIILHPSFKKTAYNIKPSNKQGFYFLSAKTVVPNAKERKISITEPDIKKDTTLCSGSIKKIGENEYEVTHLSKTKKETKIMNAKEVWNFMKTTENTTYSN